MTPTEGDIEQVRAFLRRQRRAFLNPPQLRSLLAHPHIFHWGDLDVTGLQIFHAVRRRVTRVRLSALMQPMIDLVRSGGGHPYAALTGKPAQREWQCDDAELASLLALCRSRAADQECVSDLDIRRLAPRPLGAQPN